MNHWNKFPHDATRFDYAGPRLESEWPRLHSADRVFFPDEGRISALQKSLGSSSAACAASDCAGGLQDAWRAFHAGRFARAVELADQWGVLGAPCACKAMGVYATYLESDPATQQAIYREAVARAEQAVEALPGEHASHYFLAFNLGRLGQSISIGEALRKGMAGRIKAALDRCIELCPDHADAHTALGMYHAEIIGKVGKLVGGMTYGASVDEAMAAFERAIELVPYSPIAHIEYGNGLYLIYGDKRLDEVTDLYVKATELEPADAMEKLDIEAALAELE